VEDVPDDDTDVDVPEADVVDNDAEVDNADDEEEEEEDVVALEEVADTKRVFAKAVFDTLEGEEVVKLDVVVDDDR